MKTPMQQHMEWLHKKYISHLQDEETGLALEVWYCLKNAEQMLQKEKEVMFEFAKCCTSNGSMHEIDYIYNEIFNTQEK